MSRSFHSIRTISFALIAGLIYFPSPALAAGTPTFTVDPASTPVAVNEQTPTSVFPGTSLTFVDAGTNYSGKWIEYSVDTATANDKLSFETATVADVTTGAISVVGSTIFKGNGTTADPIGVIDATKNGLNGQNLRVTFSNTFSNGSFTNTAITTVGDVVTLSGWTAYKRRVKLGGADNIAGFPTPVDNAFPARTDGTTNNDQAGDSNSYTFNNTYLGRDGTGYAVQLSNSGTCAIGYCIIRGPYIVSNSSVYLKSGDSVSFYWSALGGGDAYDVYGYLLNTATGVTIQLLNATGANGGATQPWTLVTKQLTSGQDGNYKFVFIAGTWDASGGRAEGASLLLDDVNVTSSSSNTITDLDLQGLSRLLKYEITNDAPDATKTIQIATSTGAVGGVQTLTINGVNDPMALQTPSAITRLRNMSDSSTAVGTLVAYDPDTATVTPVPAIFGISGGTEDTLTATVSKVGQYGVLSVETATGIYRYEFFVETITALRNDAFETFTVTATDGTDSPTAYLSIRLLGTLPAGPKTSRSISFISPSPLTFTKIYGETFTVTALPDAGVGDGTITYSAGFSAACNVTGNVVLITAGSGSCSISASISTGATYASASTTSSVIVTVQKRLLTVNGASQETVFGQGLPNLGAYGLIGTLAGTDAISVSGSLATQIITGSTPVNISVTFTSGSAANYDLTINPGNLVINPANLSSPSFGDPVRQLGGFTVPLNNYNPNLTNTITTSAGKAEVTGPIDGKYFLNITGISDETSVTITTSQVGYIPSTISITSGPLYVQNISLNLNGFDALKKGLSRVLKPATTVEPEGDGVTYTSLTPEVCEIKLESLVYILGNGTCTIKATGNPSPKINPGASATASFKIGVQAAPTPAPTATPKPSPTPTPKPTPTPTVTPTPQPTKPNSAPVQVGKSLVIPFDYSQYAVTAVQKAIIKMIGANPSKKYFIAGHAQPTNPQDDIRISLDRALEVRKSLAKFATGAEIKVIGRGSQNNTLCAKYKNKCVVIYVKA